MFKSQIGITLFLLSFCALWVTYGIYFQEHNSLIPEYQTACIAPPTEDFIQKRSGVTKQLWTGDPLVSLSTLACDYSTLKVPTQSAPVEILSSLCAKTIQEEQMRCLFAPEGLLNYKMRQLSAPSAAFSVHPLNAPQKSLLEGWATEILLDFEPLAPEFSAAECHITTHR